MSLRANACMASTPGNHYASAQPPLQSPRWCFSCMHQDAGRSHRMWKCQRQNVGRPHEKCIEKTRKLLLTGWTGSTCPAIYDRSCHPEQHRDPCWPGGQPSTAAVIGLGTDWDALLACR